MSVQEPEKNEPEEETSEGESSEGSDAPEAAVDAHGPVETVVKPIPVRVVTRESLPA